MAWGLAAPGRRATPSDPSADAAAQGEVTLVVWESFTRGAESQGIDTPESGVSGGHAAVMIDRVAKSFHDSKVTVRLAMGCDDVPAIPRIN